jgi:phosphotransferase family enzyme
MRFTEEHNALLRQALQVAREIAADLGAGQAEPVLLRHSEHISILLPTIGMVARLRSRAEAGAVERLCRELAVARHLAARQAPIVMPSTTHPAGPHVRGEFALTLWPYVDHVPADRDNPDHVARAAVALRRVHDALAGYPGELPSFRIKIEECRALLGNRSALPTLPAADRAFLLTTHDRIMASLEAWPFKPVPLHGDAGAHNVFITADGARYADFEDASLGPREWDVGFLPGVETAPFEPLDRNLLAVLGDLRSVCVSVWCFARYEMPDKREAADYHLAYLKERCR